MSSDEIMAVLVEYLERKKPLPNKEDISRIDYLAAGYVDSLGFMKFLMFMEERFDIEFDDEELESDAFRTIGGLERLVDEKQRGRSAC